MRLGLILLAIAVTGLSGWFGFTFITLSMQAPHPIDPFGLTAMGGLLYIYLHFMGWVFHKVTTEAHKDSVTPS